MISKNYHNYKIIIYVLTIDMQYMHYYFSTIVILSGSVKFENNMTYIT